MYYIYIYIYVYIHTYICIYIYIYIYTNIYMYIYIYIYIYIPIYIGRYATIIISIDICVLENIGQNEHNIGEHVRNVKVGHGCHEVSVFLRPYSSCVYIEDWFGRAYV